MPNPLIMAAINNRFRDPRGVLGMLSRGRNTYPGGSNTAPNTPGPTTGRGLGPPPSGTNRSLASGNNPGNRWGQLRARVDKRPVPALSSNNPYADAIRRRLQPRSNTPRSNAAYRE